MLPQFDQMEAKLQAEKGRIEILLEAQEEILHSLDDFDGKIYNVRIVNALQEKFPNKYTVYFSSDDRKELIISIRRHSHLFNYTNNTVFDKMKKTITDDNEKRFDAGKFRAAVMKDMEDNKQRLSEILDDLENGEARLKEVEMVRKYYTEIVKKFSRFTQAEFDRQFQITYI